MKKKTLLALGAVSLLGVVTTVVLPLTLTSCSDEKTNQQPQPNPNIQVSITQSDDSKQSYITLTADVSFKNSDSGMNKSNFSYQWYYKEKSSANFLYFNPDIVKGFTSITNGTSSTLKINLSTYQKNNLEKYEFTCAAYQVTDPENYGLANPISISVNTSNPPSGDNSPQKPNNQNNNGSNGHSDSTNSNQQNSSDESHTKYIDLDFKKFIAKTFSINDSYLEKLFNYYSKIKQNVNIWSTNDLYKVIAKSIDNNYESQNSLEYWMVCKDIKQINHTSNPTWQINVQVFSNAKNGYYFKNTTTHNVSNSITFTEYVNFTNNSKK